MSGCSYSEKCPKCGGEMTCYSDWKPYDMVSGICLECGFAYDTIDRQATIDQVNGTRQALDLQPVTALKGSQ